MAKLTPTEQTLHKEFTLYGQNAKEWLKKCALLLPEISRKEIWKKKKFSSIHEYAAKLAGMSKSSVDEALWVLRKIENKPLLQKLAEEKGIGRVKPIANVVTNETECFWAEKANEMTRETLRTYVRDFKREQLPQSRKNKGLDSWAGPGVVRVELTLPKEQARLLEQLSKCSDFGILLGRLSELAEEVDKNIEAVAATSRHIPAHIDRHVVERTSGLCAYPLYRKPATSLHHTQRFALEKTHDPSRLHALCTAHERLAHKGLIDKEEESPENWQLREEPDKNHPKFVIDQMVAKYRLRHSGVGQE